MSEFIFFSFQDDISIHLYPYSAHLGQENSSCKYMQIPEVVMRMLNLQFKCDHIVGGGGKHQLHKLAQAVSVLPTGIKVWVEWG